MFSIEFTQQEILFLRQALEVVQIQGKDAKFVASTQQKLEDKLEEIEKIKQETKPK